MSESYSPERRTVLVLTGTGADGAYHAGALRALHEAGVKIDLVAGRGIGAIGAVLAAVDGASRLWDAKGLWRGSRLAHLYRWRLTLRVAAALVGALAGVLASPLVFLALAVLIYPISLILGMAGLTTGASLVEWYAGLLRTAFSPTALPTWLPRLVMILVAAILVALIAGNVIAWYNAPLRRRMRGPLGWGLAGAPLDVSRAVQHFSGGVWDLLKGGATLRGIAPDDLSRRYSELLAENLGNPGFRELLLAVHDVDARRDLVFGLVKEPFRRALFPAPGSSGGGAATASSERRVEAFDLAGLARSHLIDVIRASLSIAGWTEPALVRFAPESSWRGETHRLIDRHASLGRLFEEAAAAGAEQVIVVSAAALPSGPHELRRPRIDPLGRLGEQVSAAEAVALRDAVHLVEHRFRAVYQIRPAHNPVNAFDLTGAYDERSDRQQPLSELMEHGYEDAYRQFIEPVVAVSGEQL